MDVTDREATININNKKAKNNWDNFINEREGVLTVSQHLELDIAAKLQGYQAGNNELHAVW